MKWLVGCEESQAVCLALRKQGHDAYSCDTQECSGGFPEYHLQMDIFKAITLKQWDRGIFFPPCTDLAASGARWFEEKRKSGVQQQSIDFFLKLTKTPFPHAIENPIGIMSKLYRKPDQIIHPYYFGDPVTKSTCLWLHNLPKLKYCLTNNLFETKTSIEPEYVIYNSKKTKSGKSKYSILGTKPTTGNNEENRRFRSKTFQSIAEAIAIQW